MPSKKQPLGTPRDGARVPPARGVAKARPANPAREGGNGPWTERESGRVAPNTRLPIRVAGTRRFGGASTWADSKGGELFPSQGGARVSRPGDPPYYVNQACGPRPWRTQQRYRGACEYDGRWSSQSGVDCCTNVQIQNQLKRADVCVSLKMISN